MHYLAELGGFWSPGGRRLQQQEREELAAVFRALADPTRIAIVNRLAGEEELCVCHLVDEVGLSQPTVSHHLKVLSQAGIVTSQRRGTWVYYRLVSTVGAALGKVMGLTPELPVAAVEQSSAR
jgi:ArsR family transcriptional regulator